MPGFPPRKQRLGANSTVAPGPSDQRMPESSSGGEAALVNVSSCGSGLGARFNPVGGTRSAHMKLGPFQSLGLILSIHTNALQSLFA